MAGLTADGTLYVSEKPKKEDVDRAEKEAAKSKSAEKALEERLVTLGWKH